MEKVTRNLIQNFTVQIAEKSIELFIAQSRADGKEDPSHDEITLQAFWQTVVMAEELPELSRLLMGAAVAEYINQFGGESKVIVEFSNFVVRVMEECLRLKTKEENERDNQQEMRGDENERMPGVAILQDEKEKLVVINPDKVFSGADKERMKKVVREVKAIRGKSSKARMIKLKTKNQRPLTDAAPDRAAAPQLFRTIELINRNN